MRPHLGAGLVTECGHDAMDGGCGESPSRTPARVPWSQRREKRPRLRATHLQPGVDGLQRRLWQAQQILLSVGLRPAPIAHSASSWTCPRVSPVLGLGKRDPILAGGGRRDDAIRPSSGRPERDRYRQATVQRGAVHHSGTPTAHGKVTVKMTVRNRFTRAFPGCRPSTRRERATSGWFRSTSQSLPTMTGG